MDRWMDRWTERWIDTKRHKKQRQMDRKTEDEERKSFGTEKSIPVCATEPYD